MGASISTGSLKPEKVSVHSKVTTYRLRHTYQAHSTTTVTCKNSPIT